MFIKFINFTNIKIRLSKVMDFEIYIIHNLARKIVNTDSSYSFCEDERLTSFRFSPSSHRKLK